MSSTPLDSSRQTACHRVLKIAEILEAIFDMFDPEIRQDRTTCARTALVSHMFTEPASRVFWRDLTFLTPLFDVILPRKVRLRNFVASMQNGEATITPFVWERFLICGSRIRMFSAGLYGNEEFEFVRLLLERNKGMTFLPRLQKLLWYQGEGVGTLMCSFVPKTLQKLTINPPYCFYHHAAPIFPELSTCCPELRTLRISALPYAMDELLEDISGLRHLRNLHLPSPDEYITPDDIEYLAQAFSLDKLVACVEEFEEPVPINYPGLFDLRCSGPCKQLSLLFASLNAPSMDTLKVYPKEDKLLLSELQGIFEAIAIPNFAPSIYYLAVETSGPSCRIISPHEWQIPPEFISLADLLRPCFALGASIEVLKLTFNHCDRDVCVMVSDDDILALAQGLPNLEELSIDSRHDDAVLPSPRALIHLAEHCPQLAYLELGGFTQGVLALPTSRPTPSHPLKVIWLGKPPKASGEVEDVAGLARFLDFLFPNIYAHEALTRYGNDRFLRGKGWQQVWREVQALQASR